MLVVALFGPALFMYYWSSWESQWAVIAMTWQYFSYGYGMPPYFILNPFYILMSMISMLPFFGLRLVFAFMMWRFYKNKTTKKRTVIFAIASEIQFHMFFFVTLIMSPFSYMMMPPYIPIPLLSLVGFLIYKARPPPAILGPWKGVEERDQWWEERRVGITTTPSEPGHKPTSHEEGTPIPPPKDSKDWWDEETDEKSRKEPTSPW
jgi:hypothetical protein